MALIEKNVGYSNLGDLVINFLNSQISKSVNAKNAYVLFKKHCEENNLSHEYVLKMLLRTSKYYGAFIGVSVYYSKNVTVYLNAFYTIKQTTILPLLFRIFDDFEDERINEETLCKVLNYLFTYLIIYIKNLVAYYATFLHHCVVSSSYNQLKRNGYGQ